MRVGFIGLGSQGAPMARRIIEAGHQTTLWARRPGSLEPFAASPAEVAEASDLVCLCVVGDDDVEEVTGGEQGVLAGLAGKGLGQATGSVIVVHSTVHPDTCRRLAAKADAQGVRIVDAPVSGGGPAAAEGRLLVMAGGEADAVEFCRPVFESYGDPIVHLGPLGSGQVTKLLNNVLFTANLATAASALALGSSLDVDPGRLAEVIDHGSGASFALARIASAGGTVDRIAAHAGAVLAKDVRLMVDLAGSAGESAGTVLATAHAALSLLGQQC